MGRKFHPAFIGGAVGGPLMAGTTVLLDLLFGPAAPAYTLSLWVGLGISLTKVLPGIVVILLVVPRLPGTE